MPPSEDLSTADVQQATSIRKDFESALRGQKDVTIESVVSTAPQRLRKMLLEELLRAELEFLFESGSKPSLRSYCERFPDETNVIVETYKNVLTDPDFEESLILKGESIVETRLASDLDRESELSQTSDLRESRTDVAEASPFFFVPDVDQKYVVEKEIDRGGMGVVLKVKDLHLNRTLAMKVIRGQEAVESGASEELDAEKLERFMREASITGRLDHPGVVPVHELGKDGSGRSYFTMKFVQGDTLSKVFKELRDGKCDQAHVIEVLIRVCDTIAFAHSKGVIHRDLKPANVMVGAFGETYVMDWGLAKVLREEEQPGVGSPDSIERGLDADGSHTLLGSVMGTPHYMPPEQAAGKIDELDERTDIYSIGALLYQLLSGHKPFDEHKTAFDVVKSVRSETPVSILEHTKKAPAELVAIANKAMQQKKEDRYSSASDVSNDLRAYLNNRVVSAYRTGFVAVIEKWLVRNRSIVGTALLILITSLGVIAYLQYGNVVEVSEKNTTLESQKNKLEEQKDQLDKRGEELAKSLEKEKEAYNRLWGQKLVLEANNILTEKSDATLASLLVIEALERYKYDAVETQSTLYAGASKLSESLILGGHEDHVSQAIFSPNGRQALTISLDGTGIVWDATTGKQISLILNKSDFDSSRGDVFRSAAFSKSGDQILAAGNSGTVGVWETQTGTRKLSIDISASSGNATARPSVSKVQFSPDEKQLIAATANGLFLFDSATGEQVGILKTDPESELGDVSRIKFSPEGTSVIACSKNGRFFVWDVNSRKLIRTNEVQAAEQGKPGQVRSLNLNSDGSLFVTASDSSNEGSQPAARIWNTATGELHSEVSLGAGISAAAFHPTRNLLIAGVGDLSDPSVQVWDLDTKKIIAKSKKLPAPARSIRFSSVGDTFVVICGLSHMSVWELEPTDSNQTLIRRVENLVGHNQMITYANFDLSGARVISASKDQTARIWNVFANRPVPLLGRTWFPGSSFTDNSIRMNSKSNRILTTTTDRKSRSLWSYPELKLIRTITIDDPLFFWQFSSDGELVFGGSNSGDCACWNSSDGSLIREFKNVGRLFTASYDLAKRRVILNTSEKTSVWNLADNNSEPEHEFQKSADDTHLLSQDGTIILGFSNSDGSLRQFDIETGDVRKLNVDTCQAVSFSSDGRFVWCRGPRSEGDVGMNSPSIFILDAKTLAIKHTIEDTEAGYVRWIKWAEFSPDGSKVWVQHYRMRDELADGPAISIWSTEDGKKICEFGKHGPQTHIVSGGGNADFSRLLLNTNQGVQLIDGTSGQLIATLPRSIGKIQKADFSHDGKIFISQEVSDTKNPSTGRPQSRVALWDARSGELLAILPDEQNLFLWGFLSDSRKFLTVSELNQVQLWPIDMIGETKKHLARSLSPTEQDAFLAEKSVRSAGEIRQHELAFLENRIRLLVPITADRRREAWKILDRLKSWMGENPSQQDLDSALELSGRLLSGPYDTDPKILVGVAEFHNKRGDGPTAVRLLEQAARHPRGTVVDIDQLESARNSIAPAVASYRSADALAKQIQPDGGVPEIFAAATTWAKENNGPLYQYLTAHEHYINREYETAAGILKSIVETRPAEPEPYLLYASCLQALSNSEEAVEVLWQALDIDECRSPEIWKAWLQISFNDLGRNPEQLLADLPDASDIRTTESSFGDHVRWLLTKLVDGAALQINSGYYADVTVGGEEWSADRFYTYGLGFWEQDGEAKLSVEPIAKTDKDILYQSERYFPKTEHHSTAGYQVPLPNGKYEVTLGFSEIYQASRSFNVNVENKTVLTEYDPAKGKFATAEEFKVEIELSDGVLNIEFASNNAQPAKISAISITAISK